MTEQKRGPKPFFGEPMVRYCVRLTVAQDAFLEQQANASETIRNALDAWMAQGEYEGERRRFARLKMDAFLTEHADELAEIA